MTESLTLFGHRATLGLWTPEEVASALNITINTLSIWRTEGKGPNFVKLGKTVFYRAADVEDWIKLCVCIPGAV